MTKNEFSDAISSNKVVQYKLVGSFDKWESTRVFSDLKKLEYRIKPADWKLVMPMNGSDPFVETKQNDIDYYLDNSEFKVIDIAREY